MTGSRQEYRREWQRKWRDENREKYRQYHRERKRKIRKEVILRYGDKCVCCGENKYEFLTIDHVNGGGRQHRKRIKEIALAEWIKRNNYPMGFQVLCYNCNNAKGVYGFCPHNDTQS